MITPREHHTSMADPSHHDSRDASTDLTGFASTVSGEITIRSFRQVRVKQTEERTKRAEMSRLVTLDQEIEGSNPSSPAIVLSQDIGDTCCKTLWTGQRPRRAW